MARKTAFRFTAVRDARLEAVLSRHAGSRRFAYNQCLALVKDALEARSHGEGASASRVGRSRDITLSSPQ